MALLGDLVLRAAARQGLYGMMVQAYGPQIRGGESAAILSIARREALYEGEQNHLLVCFRTTDLKRFRGAVRLHEKSVLILEERDENPLPDWLGTSSVAP